MGENNFNNNEIKEADESVGEILKKTRSFKQFSVDKVSNDLGIQKKYLKALEADSLEKLPRGVYGKNFLREYALYLGLDAAALIKIYKTDNEDKEENQKKELFSKKRPKSYLFISLPKVIKSFMIVAVTLVCVAYLLLSLKNIIAPPKLTLIYPDDNITTEDHSIIINGQTDKEAEVSVNEELILADPDGFFTKEIDLKSGLNTITISSRKKYSQVNTIIRKILVKSEE